MPSLSWFLVLDVLLYTAGLVSAIDVLFRNRSAQGATAWIFSLIFVPLFALPAYWFFGRARFSAYVHKEALFDEQMAPVIAELEQRMRRDLSWDFAAVESERQRAELLAFAALSQFDFVRGNDVELLVDGEATFARLFEELAGARRYILAQYYTIADDEIGGRFRQALLDALGRGVTVHLLYDEIGCLELPDSYLKKLEEAGARVSGFAGHRSLFRRFQLNFRNHRKIVVIDGSTALMGGLNVSDDYLGRNESIGFWRDTHLRLAGPAVAGLQIAFLQDWHYASGEILEDLEWAPETRDQDARVLILRAGPHHDLENCGLMFTHLIESAERRLWIASPYFVPDDRVLGALQLAALRGVDVKVIVPRSSDLTLFRYVPYAFFENVRVAGVEVYLYEKGFMHQKVLLVDDDYALISTANLDNRSFRLNFEVSAVIVDQRFCNDVEGMLQDDLGQSTLLSSDDLKTRTFLERVATQTTRLLAPIL